MLKRHSGKWQWAVCCFPIYIWFRDVCPRFFCYAVVIVLQRDQTLTEWERMRRVAERLVVLCYLVEWELGSCVDLVYTQLRCFRTGMGWHSSFSHVLDHVAWDAIEAVYGCWYVHGAFCECGACEVCERELRPWFF